MTTDSRERFWREVQSLRQQSRPPRLREIVEMGLRAGLSVRELLGSADQYGRRVDREPIEALSALISSLCQQTATSVLEYSATASLLTLYFAEPDDVRHRGFVTPDAEMVMALRGAGATTFVHCASKLPAGSVFDVIVCQTAFGEPRAGDGADADGFGGEVVREVVTLLADRGAVYWITARAVLWTPRARRTFSHLEAAGVNVVATIELPPGALVDTTQIPGAVIALRREVPEKRFVGALRDVEAARPMAAALIAGPRQHGGPGWSWLDAGDDRTFGDLEQARVLRRLMPRGRHSMVTLRSLLSSEHVVRADNSVPDDDETTAPLYVPEYAASGVTVELSSQTAKPAAVYRLSIDTSKANPRFLAQLLNSPYGRCLRESATHGRTIERMSVASLLSIELPVPDIATQDSIVRVGADVALMRTAVDDMRSAVDHDWTALSNVAEKIDTLKAVLDIERQIADWWRELPYPLATVYRRYQVSLDAKERFERLSTSSRWRQCIWLL